MQFSIAKKVTVGGVATAGLLGAFLLGGTTLGNTSAAALAAPGTPAAITSPAPSGMPTANPSAAPAGTPATNGGSTSREADEQQETAIDPASVKVTVDQAKATALAMYPGATIGRAELEDRNGTTVWSVALTDTANARHRLGIDANGGQIVGDQVRAAHGETAIDPATVKISADQATATALAQFPGATDKKAALEGNNGTPTWDIALTDMTGARHEVAIDANSGQVVVEPAHGAGHD